MSTSMQASDHSKIGGLIVLEGPDGVGKSTLAQTLVEKLRASSVRCELVTFPGKQAGTLGRLVYDIHHDPSAFGVESMTATSLQVLHISAHLDSIEQRILPTLTEGGWVVLDRFWWSTWVYGRVAGVAQQTLDTMIDVERLQWGDVTPDAIFLIDRPDGSPDDELRVQLREGYRALAENEMGKHPVLTIQNDKSLVESLGRMCAALHELLPQLGSLNWGSGTSTPEGKVEQLSLIPATEKAPDIFSRLSPAQPTKVYETYWRFAVERQNVFFRKLEGSPPPWTDDPIIARHKFTNVYRASDRVSQYLIRHVIYGGDQHQDELFFRTILFKLFNKIETWEMLEDSLGTISFANYVYAEYDQVLAEALSSGVRIYSPAYMMPSGKTSFGYPRKHSNHLKLLESMMADELPNRIANTSSMMQGFEMLVSYPTVGNFLAYQFITDLNYSELTDFSEMEFVAAGPGALDGIHKCFADMGGLNAEDIIRVVTERQEQEFERLGLEFRTLGGRPLQLIDCQNIFCEVSKYARLKHPDIAGISQRKRIKQIYRSTSEPIDYWYPPNWGINDLMPQSGRMV